MRSKRKILLGIFWTVGVLLVLAAVGFLLWEVRRFMIANGELKETRKSLDRLYHANPFPSDANIEREKDNLKALEGEYERLTLELRHGQVEPPDWKQPTVFMARFWEHRRQLMADAKAQGVGLPEEFGFGFNRYLKGDPPAPDDVPRLAQQLTIVSNLCSVLYGAKVSDVKALWRDEFDSPQASGSSGGDVESAAPTGRRRASAGVVTAESGTRHATDPAAGILQSGALFARFHFTLVFDAKEDVLTDVLNRLAKNSMFIVVTEANITAPEGQVAKATRHVAAGETQKRDDRARDDRILSGRESAPLGVKLELDVYRFAPAKS